MNKIAFIGLGHMGGPMSANLSKSGFDLSVFDLVPAAVETAVAQGAKAAPNAVHAVTGADVIVSMLPAKAAFG